jgi:hypothetical protein
MTIRIYNLHKQKHKNIQQKRTKHTTLQSNFGSGICFTTEQKHENPSVHFKRHSILLGALAKFRKETISSVASAVCLSVHSSVHTELGSHQTDFREIRYFSVV